MVVSTENRVERYASMLRDKIAKLDAPLNGKTWQEAYDAAAIDFSDHFAYQNEQALAHASGKITSDEARVIYVSLGEVWSESNGGFSNGVDYAMKITITTIVAELIAKRLGR